MVAAVKKEFDAIRLMADLNTARVELLSAQCAADRVRLQYSPQDIVAFGERRALHRAIASAQALWRFFSEIEAEITQHDNTNRKK